MTGSASPTVPKPQQARSARTRSALLDAALHLLASAGPGAVTHRAVAEAAGVSLGAATYHFAAKDDLLGEVYRLHLERVRRRAERLAQEPGEEGGRRDLARGLSDYLAAGVRSDREGSLATFELALERARDPALRRRLRADQERSNAYAEERLGELGSSEPALDAQLLIAALNGLRLEWLAQGERSSFGRSVPALAARLAERLLGPA